MTSLLGYWAHNKTDAGSGQLRGWSDKEIAAFFDHFVRIGSTAMLFHEVREWAVEAHKRLPTCHVSYRHYLDPKRYGVSEGDIWQKWTTQQHLDFFGPDHRPGLNLNMWNEPNPGLDELEPFARKAADIMDVFGKAGIPLDMVGWGVYLPNEGDETIQRLEPLWDAFDHWYDLHSYNGHEYGTHRGLLYSGTDYNVFPTRIGRAVELIHPQVVARNHKGFRLFHGEYGGDQGFDGQGNLRGYHNYWGGQRYGQEVVGAIQKTKRPNVIGYCVYGIGNSGEFPDFDALNDKDFRDEVEAGAKAGRLAPVTAEQPQNPAQPPPNSAEEKPPVIVSPSTPSQQPMHDLPPSAPPGWMGSFSKEEQARIELGRLLLRYGDQLRTIIVDDEAYELIGKLAAKLDAVAAVKSE